MKKLSSSVIRLAHGAGGVLQEELIGFITQNITFKNVNKGIGIDELDDGATIPLDDYEREIVVTADGHTVHPLFFPGGNLGILSVCGTVNDLLMMGADPVAMTSTIILEEGLSIDTLDKIVNSLNYTAREAGVAVIAGDTKVMPRGSLDKIIIATTGIGLKAKYVTILDNNLQNGDKIILTGSIGDHQSALIGSREGLNISSDLESDVGLLLEISRALKNNIQNNQIHAMKDPTRGGIAGALNDWAKKSEVGITINEDAIPIKKQVVAISDMLGLDPYAMACEGRALLAVSSQMAGEILEKIKTTKIGKDAAIIGTVSLENAKKVLVKTSIGGTRFMDMPLGEAIPRIC